jgi:RNA polymerase sigma-70 factor (ECF subfamily)
MHEDDWIHLYRQLVPELYRVVARRSGGDRTLAEDLVQETWLRAIEHWRRRGLPREPAAWLRTVALNLQRKHFRRAPLASLGTDEPVQRPAGEAGPRAALLQWGLARMDPAAAELLAARHLDGRTLEELARERRTTARAIEGRLRRARAVLARKLGAAGSADAIPEPPAHETTEGPSAAVRRD